jgi:hypothetical protein
MDDLLTYVMAPIGQAAVPQLLPDLLGRVPLRQSAGNINNVSLRDCAQLQCRTPCSLIKFQ